PITAAEAKGIEERIVGAMRQLARTDPNWGALSSADRLTLAAGEASKQLIAEAKLKQQRVALQLSASSARLAEMTEFASAAPGRTLFDGIGEVLRRVDVAVTGIQRETMSRLMDLLEAAQPKFWQLMGQGPEFAKAVVYEAFGKASGNADAAAGAGAWLKIAEELRQRFNRAGGDVGQLDYSYFPQPHDMVKVNKAGMQAWVDGILSLLDRARYVDETTGRQLDDAALRTVLEGAWKTIATDGLNKLEPGKRPAGVSSLIVNRGSASRAIHFAGPDEYLKYMEDFGRGSVFEAMMGHVRAMSQNIALAERMGPNPKATFQLMHDTARSTGADDSLNWQNWSVSTRDVWNTLSGTASAIDSGGQIFVRRAELFQGLRNWQVFAKLQGTLLSAITDIPSYFATTGFSRVGVYDATRNLMAAFTPGAGTTDVANRMGLVAESIAQDMGRWGSEMLRDGWTSRLANTTMRISLLNAWTDAMRRAAGISVMGSLGKMIDTPWQGLDAADRARLTQAGLTEQAWAVMQMAKPEDWRGTKMVTPEAIRAIPDEALQGMGTPAIIRDDVATRLVGMLVDESEYASLAPDIFTRARVESFGQRGTWQGELARTAFLFKSFPMAMISRHWTRMSQGDGNPNRVAYAAMITVGMTVFGGLSVLLKDIASGRDPRDVTTAKFWGAAAMAGGGMSFAGDLLYSWSGGQTQSGVPAGAAFAGAALGPVAGAVAELTSVTLGNAFEAARGEDTDFGAEAVRFARSNLPFVNLWYVRTVLDRAVMHDLQEALNPGYLSRMKQRARKDWGQEFYWQPGELEPDRAPDFGNMFGGAN
ncbi:MAG: hypothetical protein ACK52V_08415, partial [Betaproteobacteria bacterium]